MIQQRQELNFKIIVFLIRIHTYAVKLFSALQIIFVLRKQEHNLQKALIPPCGVLACILCFFHHFLDSEDFSRAKLSVALY